jgi:YD repeat-containing protein
LGTFLRFFGDQRLIASQQTVDLESYSFCYDYIPAGLHAMQYPSGREVDTIYDRAGRPDGVSNYVSGGERAPHGAISELTFANGVVETAAYNSRLQPTSITAAKQTTLLALGNYYCPNQQSSCTSNNGNVLSQVLSAPKSAGGLLTLTQSYNAVPYDGVNRLKQAAESGEGTGWSQTYVHDQYGNLKQSGDGLPSGLGCTAYTLSNNRCQDLGYDAAGNVDSYGGRGLDYDAENRQKELTEAGGSPVFTYHYDGEGRRVKKVTNEGTTVYVYDASGSLAAEYTDYTPPNQPDCTTCYLTADHLGSTRVVTDENGVVKSRHDYFPFGGEIPAGYGNRTSVTGYDGDWFNPKFTAKLRDYESGLNLDYL